MLTHSFDEWSKLGYTIKKGSKASWVDNIAVFTEDQVRPFITQRYSSSNQRYPVSMPNYYQRQSDVDRDRPETVYYADGSGYLPASGPCGPLYFDRDGNT